MDSRCRRHTRHDYQVPSVTASCLTHCIPRSLPIGRCASLSTSSTSSLALSQTVFAKALNVSAETVRSWEQEKRVPEGAALRLLQVADRHPEVILENVERRPA